MPSSSAASPLTFFEKSVIKARNDRRVQKVFKKVLDVSKRRAKEAWAVKKTGEKKKDDTPSLDSAKEEKTSNKSRMPKSPEALWERCSVSPYSLRPCPDQTNSDAKIAKTPKTVCTPGRATTFAVKRSRKRPVPKQRRESAPAGATKANKGKVVKSTRSTTRRASPGEEESKSSKEVRGEKSCLALEASEEVVDREERGDQESRWTSTLPKRMLDISKQRTKEALAVKKTGRNKKDDMATSKSAKGEKTSKKSRMPKSLKILEKRSFVSPCSFQRNEASAAAKSSRKAAEEKSCSAREASEQVVDQEERGEKPGGGIRLDLDWLGAYYECELCSVRSDSLEEHREHVKFHNMDYGVYVSKFGEKLSRVGNHT